MTFPPPPSFDDSIRAVCVTEDRAASCGIDRIPTHKLDPFIVPQFELMITLYWVLTVALGGMPPIPDQLSRLGWAGQWIRRVTCQHRGVWYAFRRAVARRIPEIPYPFPLTMGEYNLASFAEALVFRWFSALPGVVRTEVRPALDGSSLTAGFRFASADGAFAYVEVVGMLDAPASTDRDEHIAAYRARLGTKLETYRTLGLNEPILVFVEDLTPCGLATKGNELLGRLGLPLRSPPPTSGWTGPQLGGGMVL